ncbi:MAG: TonB-dependent receptor [Candidatus Marinimicrobia bacterium]|nr:TonB-dependent receptor [Candidatus Neomarinimicrobiota bacterium]
MIKLFKIVTILCSFSAILLAGVGGKLAGVVTSETGEPLIGVNIIIENTDLGTATGINGQYFILNISPGKYTVKFLYIGYKTLIQREVTILSDFTTKLDVAMLQTVLEYGEEVVVIAKRPLIQKDVTSKVVIMSSDEIINMPVIDFKDVLVTRAGFTTDAGGGIHVRGGRTNEILYMIDGIVVRDPMQGNFNGSVNQNAIQEMSVISGAFNAEYGEAMSAIVNIITKEGSDKFKGKLEYITDQLNDYPYHSVGAFKSVQDSNYSHINLQDKLFGYFKSAPSGFYPKALVPLFNLPIKGSMSLNASGKLPLFNTYYFASWYYGSYDSPLPHGVNIKQDNQIKLNKKLTPRIKLGAHIHSSSRLGQSYSHTWKYRPEHQAHLFVIHDRIALTLNHSISSPLFYYFYLCQNKVHTKVGVMNKKPSEYERPLTDESVYFYAAGDQGIYSDNKSSSSCAKFDLTYQVNNLHLLKSGFTITHHNLDIYTEEQPWIGGTNFKDDTTFAPIEGSFYIQDKIEYDFIIVNLGLRYDYINPNAAMWEDIQHFVFWDSTNNVWVPAPVVDVPARFQWSPRIGIAYPVTENTVFHFSYGHFFQNPKFEAITYNAKKDLSANFPLVGNPRIKAQKTISFETGVKQALTSDIALELTAWLKDIRDLLSTVQMRYLSNQYIVYSNTDYASVKGIDITISKRPIGYLCGSINYTFSVAKGNNSTPLGGYFSAYTYEEIPHQEFYLDFDQRHDISINLNFRTPSKSEISVFGMKPFANINANLLVNAGSGLPYTPYVDPSIRVEVNSARKPWTFSADFRIKKIFNLRFANIVGFLEIKNLTNYQNVLYVFSRTGKPFDPGWSGVGSSEDANHNPAAVGQGRIIKIGTYIDW